MALTSGKYDIWHALTNSNLVKTKETTDENLNKFSKLLNDMLPIDSADEQAHYELVRKMYNLNPDDFIEYIIQHENRVRPLIAWTEGKHIARFFRLSGRVYINWVASRGEYEVIRNNTYSPDYRKNATRDRQAEADQDEDAAQDHNEAADQAQDHAEADAVEPKDSSEDGMVLIEMKPITIQPPTVSQATQSKNTATKPTKPVVKPGKANTARSIAFKKKPTEKPTEKPTTKPTGQLKLPTASKDTIAELRTITAELQTIAAELQATTQEPATQETATPIDEYKA